jgi:hypothetical protein
MIVDVDKTGETATTATAVVSRGNGWMAMGTLRVSQAPLFAIAASIESRVGGLGATTKVG